MNEKERQNGIGIDSVYVSLNSQMNFEEALSQAINEGLASISTVVAPVLRAYLDDAVFSEIGRMKAKASIKDARNLEVGLQRMFGLGARVFEKKILESLYARLSLKSDKEQNLPFSQAVKKAKQAFELAKRNHKRKPRVRTHKRSIKMSIV